MPIMTYDINTEFFDIRCPGCGAGMLTFLIKKEGLYLYCELCAEKHDRGSDFYKYLTGVRSKK